MAKASQSDFPNLRFDSRHRPDKVIDHTVGVRMVDVEPIKLAISGQIDSSLPLDIENHARCIAARLVARKRDKPIGQGIGADSSSEDSRTHGNRLLRHICLGTTRSLACQRMGGLGPAA